MKPFFVWIHFHIRRVIDMKKLILILCFISFSAGGAVLAKEVMINPITPDIRNKLRESTLLVSKVEDSMAPKVNELEKIYKIYSETCKGNENDRGCVEMLNQIKVKYKEVLSAMESELPKVRHAISSTAHNLGASIKAKTRKRDLKELFSEVAQKGSLPKIRGPLSKKLSELLKAMGRPSTNVSILELSLRTQVDLISADEILEYLDAEVNRQIVMVDMLNGFGDFSPEMAMVMRGVSELFGYDVDFGEINEEADPKSDDWRS